MEVSELLSFKPNKILSKIEDDEPRGDATPNKVRRVDYEYDSRKSSKRGTRLQLPPATGGAISSSSGMKKSILSKKEPQKHSQQEKVAATREPVIPVVTETAEQRQRRLLEEVERQVGTDSTHFLDEHKVKKLVLSFEKKANKNQEMRIKHMDNPEKFMESELDLNDAILEMKAISTMPNHYHYLVELNAAKSLLTLLGHQNADIATSVIDLLQELTDNEDPLEDGKDGEKDGINMLISTLLTSKLCALLVQNLRRLKESVQEEANGVYNSLSLVENILELKPESSLIFAKEGLLAWILERLNNKEIAFNTNKLYVSEILSILLQNDSDTVKEQLGEKKGLDTILQQLAAFKRHDPNNLEEVEFMENMFNCLCAALLLGANRDEFLRGEGLQLMNLMLREKKISRNSALKVLDHAMSGPEGVSNCNKFVEILGLRTMFPLYMKPPRKNKKIGTSIKEHEEHIVSIIASMLQNLKGVHRQRLVAKFTEDNYAKVERLVELHFKYLTKVQRMEARLERDRDQLLELVDGDEEILEEDFYLRRLDAGLFTLQQVGYIMVDLSAAANQIKTQLLRLLNIKGGSAKTVRTILREYSSRYDDKASASANVLKQKILALADKF